MSVDIRLIDSEKGSISVMVAFLLPIMILMLALIVNINQLFFNKIRLQNTVDAAVLSAAAVQAAGLNEIADLNQDMVREFGTLKNNLRGYFARTWYNRGQATLSRRYFYSGSNYSGNGVIDSLLKYQKRANTDFAIWAKKAARKVREKNLPNSYVIRENNPSRLASFTPIKYPCWFRYYLLPDLNKFSPPKLVMVYQRPFGPQQYIGMHMPGSWTILAKRTLQLPDFFMVPKKVVKKTVCKFEYELGLPVQSFVLGQSLFGKIPPLRAKATAIPLGGNVWNCRPEYKAVLIR